MFKAKKTTRTSNTTLTRTAATITTRTTTAISSTTASASTSTSRQPATITASLVRKRKPFVEESGKGCNRVKAKKRKKNDEEKEKKTSSASINSRKRKSTQNQGNGQQDGTVRKKSKSSSSLQSPSPDEEEEDSSQIFDLSKTRTPRAPTAHRDDPNQTVKTSFSRPTRMPKGENNFLKKIISLYFRCCFLQECYNLMIIKNLATLLANYIFYKTALDPSKLQGSSPPKMDQEFFYECLCAFNSNSNGIPIPNSPMKIPQAFEHSFGQLFREFAAHSCPRQLNLKLVFSQSLNIVARQLITNTNEMFRTRTTAIVKKLVLYLNPHVTTRMAGFIANCLLEREFGLEKINKNWTPLQFRSEAAASAYIVTLKEFQAYTRKGTEAERWLFFHDELLKRDYDYMDKLTTNFQWLPHCKQSKRPHVHLNKTLLKTVFPGKLGDLLRTLKKFEDPFDIFNYPRHRSLESPLEKYLYVNESHSSSSSEKKKRKRTHERNRRILQNLAHKVEKFKQLFPRNNKNLSKDGKEYLRSHFKIGSEIKDNAIDWESLQNKLRWEFVLPNVSQILKPNVLRCFNQFERISTNGIDMSFSIYKASKESTPERLKPTDLVKEDLENKLLIGVDPGVRSLATCTYSSHLERKMLDVNQIFDAKRREKPWSTQIKSREIWHKTNIACPPLRNLRLNGQETVKRHLMEIPWAKSHYSTYPHHLQQEPSQSIEEYNRNNTRFYVKSCRVFFRSPCKRWKWFSYRYLQVSQSAMAKRVLTPVLCENKDDFRVAVDQVKREMKANRQRNQQNSGNNIRNLIRKPWMEDLMVFNKLKTHQSISNIWSKVVVAFGNQSRNPKIVRGHYKTSCEKLCNSLEQLLKVFDGDVVDASEYLTSQRCHRCLNQVSEKHEVSDDIEQKPIGEFKEDSIKYKRRFEGLSKTILLKGIEDLDLNQLSDGRRRSKHELRSCSQCSALFNRDVNASVNIMNLFICNVNGKELFSNFN